MTIHPHAVVHPTAKLGSNVTIGPFVVIGPDTVIGDGCQIISNAVIEYTELGEGCIVYPHVSLGMAPQHMGYKNEKTKLVVGANCVFREGITVHRGSMFEKGVTRIGSNGYFMALSHVAHDCTIGDNVILANGVQLAGHVKLGDRCFISGLAAVHQFARVGSVAIVSGGSMVVQDVPPFATVQGDRAVLRGLNLVGMKRSGMDRASIKLVKEAYRVVFYSGLTLAEALKDSALHVDNPAVLELRKFLSEPKRGFVRPATQSSMETSQEEALA